MASSQELTVRKRILMGYRHSPSAATELFISLLVVVLAVVTVFIRSSFILGALGTLALVQTWLLTLWRSRTKSSGDPHESQVEQSLRDPDIYNLVIRMNETRSSVLELSRREPVAGELFRRRLTELRREDEWEGMSRGQLTIEPERELTFNVDALRLARKTVSAVAFQDEDFWPLPAGRSLIEANQEQVLSGVRVVRIFVLAPNRFQDQRENIFDQTGAGIECYILPFDHFMTSVVEDFVVYDEKAVRFASPTLGVLKRATLATDEATVRKYLHRFEYLLAISEPAIQYLDRLDISLADGNLAAFTTRRALAEQNTPALEHGGRRSVATNAPYHREVAPTESDLSTLGEHAIAFDDAAWDLVAKTAESGDGEGSLYISSSDPNAAARLESALWRLLAEAGVDVDVGPAST